jgi:hypothetical protein
MALHSPKATVWAIDVNERSLELTREKRCRIGVGNMIMREEVGGGLKSQAFGRCRFALAKTFFTEILLTWLPQLLCSNSEAYLVVQKNLGADSLQRWLKRPSCLQAFQRFEFSTAKQFRVLRGTRPQTTHGVKNASQKPARLPR